MGGLDGGRHAGRSQASQGLSLKSRGVGRLGSSVAEMDCEMDAELAEVMAAED